MRINAEQFEQPGLYLFPEDADPIILTERRVRCFAESLLSDEERLPSSVWQTQEFKLCEFCPARQEGGLCQAVTPMLALFDELDAYASFDKVTAVFKEKETERIHVTQTDMQDGLKYVAIMSLTRYCRRGREFWRYFRGTDPLMNPRQIAETIYLNMYWLCAGDTAKIEASTQKLKDTVITTARRQEDRMALICKNDALLNAYVETHAAMMYLTMDIEHLMKESFEQFDGAVP